MRHGWYSSSSESILFSMLVCRLAVEVALSRKYIHRAESELEAVSWLALAVAVAAVVYRKLDKPCTVVL